jgi:hypothetical protein
MTQPTSVISTAQIKPGHLMKPLRWAATRLAELVEADPQSLSNLLQIDSPRMHLIALAFAHLDREATLDMGQLLMRGSVRAVTERVLNFYPTGIKRVLRHLPCSVLDPDSYRRLIELLAHDSAANCLCHIDYIDEAVISTFHRLPPALRNNCMLQALQSRDNNFSNGLRFLVSRGAAPSFEVLVSELASISKVDQIYSKIRLLVDSLPLPTDFPPSQVAKARRIDRPAEVRSLANSWNNCLKQFLPKINAGAWAIYIWQDGTSPVACLVMRHGRLGWSLDEVNGPQNAGVDPKLVEQIHSAFSEVDIPPFDTIAAIHSMIQEPEPKERRVNEDRIDLIGA